MTPHGYKVVEIFDSIQGEGVRAGTRALFLRLAGCNLWTGDPRHRSRGRGACALWCDTEFRNGKHMTAGQIRDALNRLWPAEALGRRRWVVITGGEPLLQLDSFLVHELRQAEFAIAVETNGTLKMPPTWHEDLDWITVSPKLRRKDGVMLPLEVRQGDELKVVVPGRDGLCWGPDLLAALERDLVFKHHVLQPEDPIRRDLVGIGSTHLSGQLWSVHGASLSEEYKQNIKRCLDLVKARPRWRLALQMHKLVGLR